MWIHRTGNTSCITAFCSRWLFDAVHIIGSVTWCDTSMEPCCLIASFCHTLLVKRLCAGNVFLFITNLEYFFYHRNTRNQLHCVLIALWCNSVYPNVTEGFEEKKDFYNCVAWPPRSSCIFKFMKHNGQNILLKYFTEKTWVSHFGKCRTCID